MIIFAENVQIELKNGTTISGEILKRYTDCLILDLGFDLLRIPNSECLRIEEKLSQDDGKSEVFTNNLYFSKPDAPSQPLRKLVEELGSAVVMIRTPIGLGSGFIIHKDGYML